MQPGSANHNVLHRGRTLLLIAILHGFTHCYGVALLPLYFRIQQDLRLRSIEEATLLVTVMGAAYFGPSYGLGILADRFSRKRLLATGLAVNALGFVGLALAPNYGLALLSMVLAGLGGSFYHPSATALISRLFPEARGRSLGLAGVGAGLGFFLGPLYCGWRAVVSANWRAPVLELGVLGLVAAGLFAWLGDDQSAKSSEPRLVSKKADKLFPSAALWALFLTATFLLSFRDFAGSAMSTSASLFLQSAQQFSPKSTGLVLSAVFLMSAISNPLFGHLSDRGRIRWLGVVLVVSAIMVLLFPRLGLPWMISVFLCYGFFFMAGYPITEAALMEAVPDSVRGRVFGLFITIGGLVGNLAHWAVGDWVHKLGDRAAAPASYYPLYGVLSLMIVASLGAMPFLHALRKRERVVAPAAAGGAATLSALHNPEAQ